MCMRVCFRTECLKVFHMCVSGISPCMCVLSVCICVWCVGMWLTPRSLCVSRSLRELSAPGLGSAEDHAGTASDVGCCCHDSSSLGLRLMLGLR